MPAVCLALLTAIAFNAQLSGTPAAARISKKHAQRSFTVGTPSMVVERAVAAEHSPVVLYFDDSVELLRADCDELLQLRKKLMRASCAISRSANVLGALQRLA